MSEHKIIIVGAGMWGKKWIQALEHWPELTLSAVVARTRATLDAVANDLDLGGAECFTDVSQAIGTVDSDIVAIVSPAASHMDHIRTAMEAGKHVICEKPLADSMDAAKNIADVVRSRPNQKFMVSQTRRFNNQVETLRREVASGRIGKVDFIAFDHRVNYTGGGWRQEMDYPVIEDMICHHLDALRYITGEEAVSVFCESWNPDWSQFSGKASTNLLVEMTNGVRVNYYGTWTARGMLNSYDGTLNITGHDGSLELQDADTLLFYPATGAEQGTVERLERVPMVDLEHLEIDGIIQSFLHALANDTLPPCGIDDNLKTFAFNWAVLESCRKNARVDVQQC